ncbi:uncharacterized protein TrAFT101_002928 [Trichoderma asperellum]|uniref:uncharacterized protein n=1 Tax=Trichoderma asperellum TaxID=101201 RepID=UPI0033289DC2|nr:hypothetical protein TrAFT101_002928 [Trichoderma asperellum]
MAMLARASRRFSVIAFYTDGAAHIRESEQDPVHQVSPKELQYQSRDPPLRRKKVKLTAAVAYKATESNEWIVKAFTVPPGGNYYLEAE